MEGMSSPIVNTYGWLSSCNIRHTRLLSHFSRQCSRKVRDPPWQTCFITGEGEGEVHKGYGRFRTLFIRVELKWQLSSCSSRSCCCSSSSTCRTNRTNRSSRVRTRTRSNDHGKTTKISPSPQNRLLKEKRGNRSHRFRSAAAIGKSFYSVRRV